MLNATLPFHRQGGWRPERQGATAMDTKLRCDALAHTARALAAAVSGLEQQAATLQRMLAEHEQREAARAEVCQGAHRPVMVACKGMHAPCGASCQLQMQSRSRHIFGSCMHIAWHC